MAEHHREEIVIILILKVAWLLGGWEEGSKPGYCFNLRIKVEKRGMIERERCHEEDGLFCLDISII